MNHEYLLGLLQGMTIGLFLSPLLYVSLPSMVDRWHLIVDRVRARGR